MEDELDKILSQFDERSLNTLLFDNASCLAKPHLCGPSHPLKLAFATNEPNPSTSENACNSSCFSLSTDSQLNTAKAGSVSKNTAKSTACHK